MFPMSNEERIKFLKNVENAGTWNMDLPMDKLIQDAQEAAGNRMYIKAIDDCIEVAKKLTYHGWLIVKFEELKAEFLEGIE